MKALIKKSCRGAALAVASPFALLAHVGKRAGSSGMYLGCAQFLSLLPGAVGGYIRSAYYRLTLPRFGKNSEVCMGAVITKMETRVGDWCGIGPFTTIGLAELEDKAVVAGGCSILSGGRMHNFSDPNKGALESSGGIYKRVRIGEKSFVGDRSVVMADIGRQTIVGAGSVVAKEIGDLVVAVGNPARVIKKREEAVD
ncbi:acyltransferase [Pseudodesulfovibrio thermohalotolerans]|uniref:acyltransferase n=1 Tax=Pseudodesulfovibrio thermohalotolerans TaxID=2880651 RepID=UPI002442AD63|nr:acyltransferase [Pseudodesulfovibrio thermohalotolerans]WFS61585.1 acyltransferase [Pseudodesulfovibrio thermohalotolerans]